MHALARRLPAVNVYEQEGIVAITPGATSPLVTDTIKPHYFFRTIGRDDQQGPFAAQLHCATAQAQESRHPARQADLRFRRGHTGPR